MSIVDVTDQVLALRATGGFGVDSGLSAIQIVGKDAVSFLQARLSNDVSRLLPGQQQLTALLDRKAYILAFGILHRTGEGYLLLVSDRSAQNVCKQLENFRFREQVEIRVLSTLKFMRVDSGKCDLFLQAVTKVDDRSQGGINAAPTIGVENTSVTQRRVAAMESTSVVGAAFMPPSCGIPSGDHAVVRQSTAGEPGAFIAYDGSASELVEQAKKLQMRQLDGRAYQIAELEAGYLGLNLEGLSLPETGLEDKAVSYTKGCFPGQEVLARIRTYGAPRRGVAGLVFDKQPDKDPQAKQAIAIDGTEVGSVHSAGFSPTLKKYIAIVFVNREFRVPDRQLAISIDGTPHAVTVAALPFYSNATKAESAAELYQQALKEFASGSEQTAIEMLRKVIQLNPKMADAYETLGVVLNRHDQLDEAIELMRQLTVLDPKSIMAHANLSVFYMQQGNKEAAEEEKAIAMSIRMSELARDAAAQQAEQEERRKMKEAAGQRMTMFKEVLAIDPDDFLANSGLGSVMVDLEHFEDAIQYLRKALEKRPGHTVAYVCLGEALEKLGRQQEAIETYKQGVVVASQRGDGEPRTKMQRRLDALLAEARK